MTENKGIVLEQQYQIGKSKAPNETNNLTLLSPVFRRSGQYSQNVLKSYLKKFQICRLNVKLFVLGRKLLQAYGWQRDVLVVLLACRVFVWDIVSYWVLGFKSCDLFAFETLWVICLTPVCGSFVWDMVNYCDLDLVSYCVWDLLVSYFVWHLWVIFFETSWIIVIETLWVIMFETVWFIVF